MAFSSNQHHSFDVVLAAQYSIEESILIHHFQFWINKNKALKRNLHEGRTWTYETIEEIAAHFPYFSRDQINRILRKLVENKIIIKGNFNKNTYDRTVWYAFNKEKDFINDPIDKWRNHQMDFTKSPKGNDEIATPIPDTKTYTETYNKKSKPKKESTITESADSLDSKESHVSLEFSNDVKERYNLLVESIYSVRPTFKIKGEKKSLEEIDKMIRIDKRDINEIKQVIKWLPTNSFWKKNILCGKSLRDKYDKLCIQFNEDNEKSSIDKYKIFANRVKRTRNIISMNITDVGIYDKNTRFELTYLMQYEDFCHSLAKKYDIVEYEGAM